ncbi:MAG: murein biosynthesis integral membrane protein MurJ [Alphaproteobacteria bacterium]|nr:murein biosynthesis integral membrane protein MurJ [Alphaproteobacteria bacterium]
MNLSRAIATVGGYTMVSRILGFARDILVAAVLGAGLVADAFFVAFKLPNFFRRLFAEGAFNAAFVPTFSEANASIGAAAAARLAGEVLSVLVVFLFFLVTLAQIFMPLAMYGLAPGFADEPVKFDLAVELTQITFPYLLFISLVSLQGGILNSLGRFAAAAAAPILLNLCLIGALLLAHRGFPTPGHALAWGVALAGVVQFLWLAFELKRAGFVLRFPRPRWTPGVRNVLRLMAPGALGAGVVQINLFIDVIIASLLPEGSISFLYFADRINQLPVGVIGVAVGTALLPILSRHLAANDAGAASAAQNRSIEAALLLTLPAAAGLMVLAHPIVAVLYQRGAFDAVAAAATAEALIAFSFGLPAYVLIKVLTPAYFARKDTRTPVRIAIAAVLVNVALNLALMGPLLHVGLALATAVAAWLNAGLLAVGLRRRGYWVADPRLTARLPRTLAATAIMTLGLFAARSLWADGGASGIVTLATMIAAGGLVFAVSANLLGAATLGEFRSLLARRRSP